MAITLEEEVKRKKAEDLLSDTSSDDASNSSDDVSEPDQKERKNSDYILVPEAQVDQRQAKAGLERTYQGWGEPIPEEILRPSEKRAEGYPLEGESLVSPTPSPTLEPIVDESLRGPAPDILPQVERGELVKTPVSPAPDTLRQVERAELVKAPAEPAPDRLDQVERAALVKLPPKLAPDTLAQVERAVPRAEPVAAPDTLSQVEKGVLIGKAVPAPSKAIQEPTDRVPIPNAPIKRVGPEQIPNALVGQAKPEQLPNAPVTPEAVQAKPAPEQETTFMGMPILGREAPPQKTSTIPSQPAPSDKAPLSIDTDYNAQAGSYHAGRPGDGKIQGIVLHSSDGRESGDINTLTTGGVSSHYYVTRDGRIYQFVNDQDTAYHAGKVVGNLGNGNTIGIEQEHYDPGGKGGKNGEAWSPAQVAATARLVASLKAKYGLTDAQIVGHSDVAPDRKQDPYNYPWEDFRRQVNGQPGAVAVAGQPEKGFIKGRATTFGYHDPNDPGVGSPKLGKINTNEGSLVGIAIPEEALRAQIGASPAAWRKARVEIVTSDGRHMLVPIVDLGPGDVQQTKGIAADFTHGLATVLKHSDENNYQFRIIPNAGVDVTKNPQAFVAEQAQLAKGVDLSPKAKTPAALMGGYVLVPETEEQKADSTQQVQAQVQAQQNVLSALHDHTQNMPSWYHALEKPIPGVSDAVRDATREEFKKQITAYAQDYYKEPDPDKAFVRIMQAPNLLTSAGEILSKAPAHVQHALLAWSRGLDANGENRIIDFINKVHPEATPEARAGFVREILSKPAGNERTQFVSALYSSVDPQITQGISLPALLDSIDTVSQPGYQEKRKTEINAAVAKNLKDLRTDPTMENTWGGTVSDAIAQMPKNLGEALFPVIGQSAMTSEIYFDTLDGLRKEHPDWSEDQLKAKAGAASVPQVVLQEVVNLATMGLGGGLVKGITNPVARIAANSILHGGIAGTAATVQQGVANVATGRPITEGMPQAAIVGGIQGTIGGAMHAPEARPRGALEPTTGPKGGEIRGPTERTLEETHPPPVTAQGEPVRPVEPSIVRPEVQPPPLPPEAHSDQNLEQRSIPSVRTPEEGNRGMTEEEAHAYLDTLSNEIEQRHQARASDVGLIPREENPHATVHDVPPPVPTTPSVPPERFSLGAPVPEKGLSVPEANKVVNAFKEQFPHAPPIDVVGARTELPAHLQDAIAQHAGDHSVEALIHDGRVRVVAGENVSPEQLHKALLEESIGHYGVEQVLGKKFDHLTNVVSKSMTGHPQYEALKPIYGDNPRTLAAEYIARAARGQIESPSVWAHVKTWFNQLARKLGFRRAFSDSELRVLLSRARGRLEKGGGRSTVVTGAPRFHLRKEDQPSAQGVEITRPSKEELPGKHWYSPSRLVKGPRWIRSAYDQLASHPLLAPLASALMHRTDRAQELRAQWSRSIIKALRGMKPREMKTVLADFAKLQEAKDNKQPQPTGLHPDAYKLERAVRATSEQVAELAKANKILVFDQRLNNGKGGYRPFRAASDYVPRNVKREVIDAMRLRHNSPADIARWTSIVHDFINKGYAKNEAEVIDNIKGAANLDTKHIDSKMGNLEKARVSRLPSNMYEYSLPGMLDYIQRASDRMSEVEAYGQRGEMFQKAVDRIEKSPLAGSEQGKALINTVKALRNRELGLDQPSTLGKAMAISRSFATGMDLSGWMGMFNDLIGSVSVVPSHMGIWNTAKGYYHALTHFKQMMSHAEDLGTIHEDYGRATREIDQNYQSGALSDRLGRIGSKMAEMGLAISGRTTQEKFIRTMTLGATMQMLRKAVDTIRKNPTSRQAGAWAHYLQRRGVDVSKLVTEGGIGPESDRLMRRGVADTQAGYDLIQRSPWMESPAGKFFAQYMSWGVNQTRNVMREIVLPILRPTQKTIDVTVNGKKYTVSDSRLAAVQRGLMLAVAGSATGMLTDQLREFFLGRIQSYRDLKQLAVDIASHPDKAETFAYLANSMTSEILTGGMTGMLGNFAQLVMDPTNKQRYKDPLHPTGLTKLEQVGQFLKRSMQEGQYNSHEADALLKNLFGVYREGKPIVARTMSTLGYSPNWVKEERTRQTVTALRNTLRRYNDEQGLGLKPPAFQSDYDASKHTPVAQSVVDALYRGDAAGAKKILADYMKTAPNAQEAKKRKDSVTSTVQSATPLKLGSKRNKEFAQGFWDWAQKEGNVTPAQIADYKKAVNAFADTAFNAGFKRELQIVPEEGEKKIVIAKKVSRTSTTELLREMIRKENAEKALQVH